MNTTFYSDDVGIISGDKNILKRDVKQIRQHAREVCGCNSSSYIAGTDTVKHVKSLRIFWIGHLARMDKTRN